MKDLFDTSQPVKGEAFIRVPYAVILGFDTDSWDTSKAPYLKISGLRTLIEVTVLKDTVWAIEWDRTIPHMPYRYWQYSTQHPKVAPVEFEPSEVILLDKHGEQIR